MLRTQLLSLRRQLLAAEAAPAAAGGLLSSLQQLLWQHQSQQQPSCIPGEARQYATARQQGRTATAAGRVSGAGFPAELVEDEEEPASELRLPDMRTLGYINPHLRDAILQSRTLQKSASAIELIMEAVEAAQPDAKRAQRLTKTGLGRLRIDALRELLDQLGEDNRGTKEVVVQRLLELAGAEERERRQGEQQRAAVQTAQQRQQEDGGSPDGVVSRRQLAAQAVVAQRLAEAASRGGSYGLPGASLAQAHRDMVEQSQYAAVFSPQEVAEILAEARADDIAIIDVRGHCPFTDYMVLATARSQRLAYMLASAVLHALKARAKEVAPGVTPNIEGALDDSEWMVVDAGSVVTHVFLDGYRQEYDLEELWGLPDGSNITRVAPKATIHTLDTLEA